MQKWSRYFFSNSLRREMDILNGHDARSAVYPELLWNKLKRGDNNCSPEFIRYDMWHKTQRMASGLKMALGFSEFWGLAHWPSLPPPAWETVGPRIERRPAQKSHDGRISRTNVKYTDLKILPSHPAFVKWCLTFIVALSVVGQSLANDLIQL